jgi:hypothetical protein
MTWEIEERQEKAQSERRIREGCDGVKVMTFKDLHPTKQEGR